jgi:dihydrofolate reductase
VLEQLPGKNIGIHGSPTLVETILQADLVDELRLEIHPVIDGRGARLFHDGRAVKYLQLVDSKKPAMERRS